MDEKVCVLMNCYNGSRYLRYALDSLLAQTYRNWELIFWDNQSTDASRDIVHSYGDQRIKYFLTPRHTNLAEARRMASEYFSGGWIGFLDCDDVWFPDKLEKQLEIVGQDHNGDIGLIYSRARLLVEPGWQIASNHVFEKTWNLPSGRIFSRLLRGNFIALCSILVNKAAFDAVGGFVGKYPIMEDYSLSLRITRYYPAKAINEELCGYRIHGNNDSLANSEADSFEDLSIVRGFYPDPRALAATLRIVGRHLKKCYQQRRAPALYRMAKSFMH